MMQGLNILIDIKRETAGTDDDVGGATVTTATVSRNIRARISAVRPTDEQRIQGIESSNVYTGAIWPASTDIRFNDVITPSKGPHSGSDFRVTGTRVASLFDADPRAHISVGLVRTDRARTLQ